MGLIIYNNNKSIFKKMEFVIFSMHETLVLKLEAMDMEGISGWPWGLAENPRHDGQTVYL